MSNMAELITAALASLALAAGGTVFTINDEERGLYNMHPELVKGADE